MAVPAGTSGDTMNAGVPYCPTCDADMMPSGPRQHEGHFAARFGRDDRRHHSIFDGETKLLAAYEVQAGPGGWVIEGIGRRACPRCGMHPLVRLRFSDDLRVVRDVPALADQRQEGP